jgi:predicted DCC family thiol-disulfide oxidoreductase YuxK
MVQFLLKHDREGRLRFASLQSDFAQKVLGRHGLNAKDLDTIHIVENYDQPGERVLQRSDAVLRAGRELGGFWGASSSVAKVVPRALRDLFYRLVATNRYRVFGKYDSCMLPDVNQRSRFLDV